MLYGIYSAAKAHQSISWKIFSVIQLYIRFLNMRCPYNLYQALNRPIKAILVSNYKRSWVSIWAFMLHIELLRIYRTKHTEVYYISCAHSKWLAKVSTRLRYSRPRRNRKVERRSFFLPLLWAFD